MNKLGISEYYCKDIEQIILKFKIDLLDQRFTFNCDFFSFNYIIKLHSFLFDDLYLKEYAGLRKMTDADIKKITELVLNIKKAINIYPFNVDSIINIFKEIIKLEPFGIGNVETLYAYLKIIKNKFQLNIDLNIFLDLIGLPKNESFYSTVNQKKLTK